MKTKKKKLKKVKIKPITADEYKSCFYGPNKKCVSCE